MVPQTHAAQRVVVRLAALRWLARFCVERREATLTEVQAAAWAFENLTDEPALDTLQRLCSRSNASHNTTAPKSSRADRAGGGASGRLRRSSSGDRLLSVATSSSHQWRLAGRRRSGRDDGAALRRSSGYSGCQRVRMSRRVAAALWRGASPGVKWWSSWEAEDPARSQASSGRASVAAASAALVQRRLWRKGRARAFWGRAPRRTGRFGSDPVATSGSAARFTDPMGHAENQGKEGVAGSSPAEGSCESPAQAGFFLSRIRPKPRPGGHGGTSREHEPVGEPGGYGPSVRGCRARLDALDASSLGGCLAELGWHRRACGKGDDSAGTSARRSCIDPLYDRAAWLAMKGSAVRVRSEALRLRRVSSAIALVWCIWPWFRRRHPWSSVAAYGHRMRMNAE
jgi:hypothetical protein